MSIVRPPNILSSYNRPVSQPAALPAAQPATPSKNALLLSWLANKMQISWPITDTTLFQRFDQTLLQAQAVALNLSPTALPNWTAFNAISPSYKAMALGLPLLLTSEQVDQALFRKVVQETLPMMLSVQTPVDAEHYRSLMQELILMAVAKPQQNAQPNNLQTGWVG